MTEKQKSIPVASLKSMGDMAPEFDMPVTVKRIDGAEFQISFKAKALRKTEWAAARDVHTDGATDRPTAVSYENMVKGGMKNAADLVLKCTSGWSLDDAYTPENLMAMEDRCAGSFVAILTAYDTAIFQGILGN